MTTNSHTWTYIFQTQDKKQQAIVAALVIDPLVDVDAVMFCPVLITASTIPDLPTFLNPGRFKSLVSWIDK